VTCVLCGKPIEDTNRRMVARQVVGWDVWRPGGGQNALFQRKETGALAHAVCVKYRKPKDLKQDQLWIE
jgi:hypothetical protein